MNRKILSTLSALLFIFVFSQAAQAQTSNTFYDVDLNHDHYTAIEYLVNLGVLEGYTLIFHSPNIKSVKNSLVAV